MTASIYHMKHRGVTAQFLLPQPALPARGLSRAFYFILKRFPVIWKHSLHA